MRYLILSILLLSGCSKNLSEFRNIVPVEPLATVKGQYQPLASCVMDGLQDDLTTSGPSYRLLNRANLQKATIVGNTLQLYGPFTFEPSPIVELIFVQSNPESVSIQARADLGGEKIAEAAKPIIHSCASSSLVQSQDNPADETVSTTSPAQPEENMRNGKVSTTSLPQPHRETPKKKKPAAPRTEPKIPFWKPGDHSF